MQMQLKMVFLSSSSQFLLQHKRTQEVAKDICVKSESRKAHFDLGT